MVQILNQIPQKEAKMVRLPKYMPRIDMFGEPVSVSYQETIKHDRIVIPKDLMGEYFNAFEVNKKEVDADNVEEIRRHILAVHKNPNKEVYVRYVGEHQDKPIKIVSGKFEEVDLRNLSDRVSEVVDKVSGKTGTKPLIRQFDWNERLVLNFPLHKNFPGLHLLVDGGTYSTYGGSGESALQYGISWNNDEISQWTLFLGSTIDKSYGRAIHLKGNMLPTRLNDLIGEADKVVDRIEGSRRKKLDQETVHKYLNLYSQKGFSRSVVAEVLAGMPETVTTYDLAQKLVKVANGNTRKDRTRHRAEALAGEVIFNYKDIKF